MDYVKKRVAYKGRRITVEEVEYKLEGERTTTMEHVRVKSAVGILATTMDNKFVFIEECRTAIGNKKILEIPAGLIEEDEEPLEAAIRELEEETGYFSKDLELLTKYYPSCGYSDEVVYIYLAKISSPKSCQHLDDEEDIKVIEMSINDAFSLLENGEILNSALLTALLYYKFKMEVK